MPICKIKTIIDVTKSAAVLAWEHFLPAQRIPPFYGYIQDHDLGRNALPQSHAIHLAVECYPRDFKTWLAISGITLPRDPTREYMCLERLEEQGMHVEQFVEQRAQEMASACRTATIDCEAKTVRFAQPQPESETVHNVPAANASVLHSMVCKKLLERNPDAKMAAVYCDLENGKRQWSLRSRNGFDCSVVAKYFGGGGHPQASGFQTFHNSDSETPAILSPIVAHSAEV